MRRSRLGVALVLALVGMTWLAQGVGAIGGSAMSGSPFWAVVGTGLVVVAIGLVLLERRAATHEG